MLLSSGCLIMFIGAKREALVVVNRATQDTFYSPNEIKICNFYIPFFESFFYSWENGIFDLLYANNTNQDLGR